MKFSYIALIFVFLFSQLQITFASEAETISVSEQTDHGCSMSHHDTMKSAHDCCQHDSASNMHCPSCGDNCHCGPSCHFSMHSVDIFPLTGFAFQPVVASFVESANATLVSAELTLEKRPPKFS